MKITPFLVVFLFHTLLFSQSKHTVAQGENLYQIGKKYGVSVEDIVKTNPKTDLTHISIGQEILLPAKAKKLSEQNPAITKPMDFSEYVVKTGDTWYSLSKEYGTTVETLQAANAQLQGKLSIGQSIRVPNGEIKTEPQKTVKEPTNAKPKEIKTDKPKQDSVQYYPYIAKPDDTLYGIARVFRIEILELLRHNPSIQQSGGLKEGMRVNIPYNKEKMGENQVNPSVVVEAMNKEIIKPTKSEGKNMTVAFLLPFRPADGSNSNASIDFYMGAKRAIDSLKRLGISFKIKTLDTEKNTATIDKILASNVLDSCQVVIGPLHNEEVDYLSLKNTTLPIIAPLSKKIELDNRPNVVMVMPTAFIQNSMLVNEILKNYNQETIAILSDSDEYYEFIVEKLKEKIPSENIKRLQIPAEKEKFAPPTSPTIFVLNTKNTDAAKSLLAIAEKSNKEKVHTAYGLTDLSAVKNIARSTLTALKYTFVDDTRQNGSVGSVFAVFRKESKSFPSKFQVWGFDITFDTLLRLSQYDTIEDAFTKTSSSGMQTKFDYRKKENGGYYNVGSYVITLQ